MSAIDMWVSSGASFHVERRRVSVALHVQTVVSVSGRTLPDSSGAQIEKSGHPYVHPSGKTEPVMTCLPSSRPPDPSWALLVGAPGGAQFTFTHMNFGPTIPAGKIEDLLEILEVAPFSGGN